MKKTSVVTDCVVQPLALRHNVFYVVNPSWVPASLIHALVASFFFKNTEMCANIPNIKIRLQTQYLSEFIKVVDAIKYSLGILQISNNKFSPNIENSARFAVQYRQTSLGAAGAAKKGRCAPSAV